MALQAGRSWDRFSLPCITCNAVDVAELGSLDRMTCAEPRDDMLEG